MRNHPLDGIEREKLTIRDVRVIPISHVDSEGDLWRSGTYPGLEDRRRHHADLHRRGASGNWRGIALRRSGTD